MGHISGVGMNYNPYIVLLHLLVALQVADVVAAAGHFHGVDGGLGAEPGDVAAAAMPSRRTKTSCMMMLPAANQHKTNSRNQS